MLPIVRMLSRIARVFVSLGVSVLAGSTLAVAAVEGRLSVLADLVWRAAWTMRGRPQAPGEADGTWMLEIEWKIALMSALVIALVGSVIWAFVSRRGLQSNRAAALVGFILAAGMAVIWLNSEPMTEATRHIPLIGFIGAATGVFTYAIDKALVKLARASPLNV